VVAARPRSKVDFEDWTDHGDERRGKARANEDTNDPHKWPCGSGSRVGLMARIERDGVRLAGIDQSTLRIQAEGSATEVRRRCLPLHRNQPIPESQTDGLKSVTLRDLIERKGEGS
jgi:hypothetical protein